MVTTRIVTVPIHTCIVTVPIQTCIVTVLIHTCIVCCFIPCREVAVRVGQALVDTKRLKIVSSLDQEFKDESNIFLELGEAASLQPDPASPTVTDAPKWFQHLREDADSEYEVSAGVDNTTMRATR